MYEMNDALKGKVLDFINAHRDDIIADTARIIQYRTISSKEGKLDEETVQQFREAFEFVKDLGEKIGCTFRMLDDKVGILEMKADVPDAETIGILSHIDVMPPGEAEWKYEPYGGHVAEDKIWGRGAQDDKGPMIAHLYGLQAVKEAAGEKGIQRTIRIIIATQEETGDWSDIHLYREKEGAPDFCIAPDAEYPIIVAEKGMVNIELNASWDETPRSDTIDAALVSVTAGERANMVPDKARIILKPESSSSLQKTKEQVATFVNTYKKADIAVTEKGDTIELECAGNSAHGSRPFEGHNAAVDALRFLGFVKMHPPAFQKYVKLAAEAGDGIYGETLGIEHEHHFVGKTTNCMGIMRIDGKKGSVTCNIRQTAGVTVKDIEKGIASVLENVKAQEGLVVAMNRASSGTEPLYVDPADFSEFIEPLKFAYHTVTGRPPDLRAIGGTTFAKAFPRAVSFGPVLLDEENEMAHQVNEHVAIEHQMRNAKIYALALAGLLLQPEDSK